MLAKVSYDIINSLKMHVAHYSLTFDLIKA
jgi:hypothetical protein